MFGLPVCRPDDTNQLITKLVGDGRGVRDLCDQSGRFELASDYWPRGPGPGPGRRPGPPPGPRAANREEAGG
jgi:hypothetical protein